MTLLPDMQDSVPVSAVTSDPRTGDTLWWLADTAWRPLAVTSAGAARATCSPPMAGSGATYRVTGPVPDTIQAGTPVRVSRQARYGTYRASDGTWQLGYREWSDPTHRFAAPQPVVGPLLPRNAARPSGFRYFDSTGTELLPARGPIDVSLVAKIRVTANTLVPARTRLQDSVRADSVDVALRRAAPP